jgi:hypothetical protein
LLPSASGLSRNTIYAGYADIANKGTEEQVVAVAKEGGRVHRAGGGRKSLREKDKYLEFDLNRLLDPVRRGDPVSPLRWTCKSTPRLAAELKAQGHAVSQSTVWRILDGLNYSMQFNRKAREGTSHVDRNARFEFLYETATRFMSLGLPVISVDTKKKELVGNYKNTGQKQEKKGQPGQVNMHDFPDRKLGKVNPYGVYDVGRNEGWVRSRYGINWPNLPGLD